jgi:zinc/manganese transport system substrate-binding protein
MKFITLSAITTTLIVTAFSLDAKINIITSIPERADISREVGGDSIAVFSLARGTENYHMIQARSSFLPKINRANLVVCLGLEAEDQWLVPIVAASRNDFVKKGSPGWIEAYKGVTVLDVPDHPELIKHVGGHRLGNPHFNSGPYCGKPIATNIYNALLLVDKQHEAYYRHNYDNYLQQLDNMEVSLKKKAVRLKGIHVISYHPDLNYFCNYFGMVITGYLEPKPGIPPNAAHLASLSEKARQDSVKLVLYHQAQDPQLPEKIAERIGAQAVCFANMVKSRETISTFIELQEYNVDLMLKAIASPEKK